MLESIHMAWRGRCLLGIHLSVWGLLASSCPKALAATSPVVLHSTPLLVMAATASLFQFVEECVGSGQGTVVGYNIVINFLIEMRCMCS